MGLEEEAQRNMEQRFRDNPCRGFAIGMNNDGGRIAVTWVSERRENSRNMIYAVSDGAVRTEIADHVSGMDPLPEMHTAMIDIKGGVIAGNASQTQTLYESMKDFSGSGPGCFFGELSRLYCEPDAPVFTPKITGYVPFTQPQVFISMLKADAAEKEKWLSLLEKSGLNRRNFRKEGIKEADVTKSFNDAVGSIVGIDAYRFPTTRLTFDLTLTPGYGYCITTYRPGSSKLDSFEGEPFIVPIRGVVENVMESFWNVLEPDWRAAICGKCIKDNKTYTAKPINNYSRKEANR